ncbi:hypothetical protein GCM10022236_07730 [Microlunatus ginsengisoli]|uniref:DUF998 domain-containing protein n=2 Tax=Microlunatus ginsengisoli TaxID=363863 RepID=A0ABP6ZH27_9ACTN
MITDPPGRATPERAPVEPHPRRALIWPVLGLIAMITYNTWVLWIPVNGHPHIIDGYLSELSASDQPRNLFFRGGDLITSLIVGALGIRAVLVWRHRARRTWWLVSAWALIVFAVATFFDAFFAMDCSPTLDTACRIAEEAGRLSDVHYAHTYTSVLAQTGVVTSILAAYVALRRSYPGSSRRRWWLLAGAVIEVSALTIMLVMIAAGLPWLGIPQAVIVAVASIWFAAVGFGVLGPPLEAKTPDGPAGPDAG